MDNQITTLSKALELKGRKALDFFSKEENIKPLVAAVAEEALSIIPAVATKKGRDAIGSNALKVSKSRKAITEAIELTIADHQAKVKAGKALSKFVTTELNQVRTDILQPREEWQKKEDKKEEERVSGIQARISKITELTQTTGLESKEELSSLIEAIENIDISHGFQEFSGEAAGAKADATKLLNDKIVSLVQEEIIAEQNKAAEIEARINTLRMTPTELFGQPSSAIQENIDFVNNFDALEADFGDRVAEVEQVKLQVVAQLTQMKDMVLLTEQAVQPAPAVTQDAPAEFAVQIAKSDQVDEMPAATPIRPTRIMTPYEKSEFLKYLQLTWDGYDAALANFNKQRAA